MPPQLILNVDDREVNRYIRTRILQQAGYRVIEADSGRGALELFQEQRPSLVLLDLNLPDINGLEVCRSMRAMDPGGSIVIVHISATSTETGDQVRGLDNGAHAYLTDPVDEALLVATVRSLLALRNTSPSAPRAEYLAVSGELDKPAVSVRGRTHVTNPALAAGMNEAADYNLTARELEVLGLMAAGQTTKELAYNLGISFKTAACHRNRILGKFGAHNTAEVISRAIATGLITV